MPYLLIPSLVLVFSSVLARRVSPSIKARSALQHLASRKGNSGWLGLAIAGGVDLLIDGFLMGVAFSISRDSGILLTIAITFEVLFLGFTFTVSFANRKLQQSTIFFLLFGLAVLVFLGAVTGYRILGALEPSWRVSAMAFGCVALLYLVTEELLVEAHEREDCAIAPYLLFAGFGIMLTVSMVL